MVEWSRHSHHQIRVSFETLLLGRSKGCFRKLHKIQRVHITNPTLLRRQAIVTQLHTSTVRGITCRSQHQKTNPSGDSDFLGAANTGKSFEIGTLANKEGISIVILRTTQPDKVTFPPEPNYEEEVDNSTAQSERDRRIQNEQLKIAWLNKCQKIEAA